MQTLSVGDAIRSGWETFKKRPWFFIGVTFLIVIISSIISALTPDEPSTATDFIITIAAAIVGLVVEIGLITFALKANHAVADASFKDLWNPKPFWRYLGVKILTGIIVVIGLILLIVPGIIAALALILSTYLVIDRNLGPIEAMKESVRLTKGHRWTLFGLALAILGLNILGALAVLVGLLVSIPVSMLSVAYVYRTLAGKVGE